MLMQRLDMGHLSVSITLLEEQRDDCTCGMSTHTVFVGKRGCVLSCIPHFVTFGHRNNKWETLTHDINVCLIQ